MGLSNQRGKNQSATPSNAAELKPRRCTTFSMQLISQWKEINCFEGMSLNGLSLMRILFLFDREQGFRGRKEINLLVHACRSILSLFPSFFFLSFFLPFLSRCLLILLRFSHRGCYYSAFCDCDPPLCTVRPLFYSTHCDRILPF